MLMSEILKFLMAGRSKKCTFFLNHVQTIFPPLKIANPKGLMWVSLAEQMKQLFHQVDDNVRAHAGFKFNTSADKSMDNAVTAIISRGIMINM